MESYENLQQLYAATAKERDELKKALEQAKAERKAAYRKTGGEPPKTCKTCDHWGKDGWSQHQIDYCEGADRPHDPDDFCSMHCHQKEA